ncbi:uncharacterized protein LOC142522433 [Primulina tabacum]|uniref:uncharacterized protein LOC142522433 n=1 Tax=Primulina tabacum TaxID=48773 RepID=UPI003F5AC771
MSAEISSRCINFHVNGCSNLHLPCIRPAYYLSREHCKVDRSQRFLKSISKYGISTAVTISKNSLPRASSSSDPSTAPWKKWLLGVLFTVILPAAGHKGGLFVGLKAKIDKAIETVEVVTDVVEGIAEETDKIVEEVESKLPGDSKLRKTLDKLDDLTKKAVDEAKQAEDIIHKVREVEQDIEDELSKASKDEIKK